MSTTTTEPTIDRALQKKLVFAWLDALRSGEWKQAKGALELRGKGNCCLGVACRVAISQGFNLVTREEADGSTAFNDFYGSLPESMTSGLGVSPLGTCAAGALAGFNDEGKTFPEIADIIEANARTLFVNGEEVAGWLASRNDA